jgi:hypothetical protein
LLPFLVASQNYTTSAGGGQGFFQSQLETLAWSVERIAFIAGFKAKSRNGRNSKVQIRLKSCGQACLYFCFNKGEAEEFKMMGWR